MANSSPTLAAARVSSAPTTIRSGFRLSSTAVPSRRNSGFETTLMSGRPITCSTMVAEPTGTVDLLTTMAPGTQVRRDLLGRRLDVGQVGRPVGALRRGHAEEHELRAGHGVDGRLGEGEVAGAPRPPPPVRRGRPPRWACAPSAAPTAGSARARPARPCARSGPAWPPWAGRRSRRRSRPPSAGRARVAGLGGLMRAPACDRSAATSRARPSCQSGRRGSPLRRSAMLSSTE